MSKNQLIIMILAIFLLLGTTSFAMGAVPDDEYTTTIGKLASTNGDDEAYLNSAPGWVQIKPDSASRDNIYSTLTAAWVTGKSVEVRVYGGYITKVRTA